MGHQKTNAANRSEESLKREADRLSDGRFQTAMQLAIACGHERAPYLGIKRAPCTDHPRLVGIRNEQGGRMQAYGTLNF